MNEYNRHVTNGTSNADEEFGFVRKKSRKRKLSDDSSNDNMKMYDETHFEDEEESDGEDGFLNGSSSSDEEENDSQDHNLCPICLGEFTDQLVGIPENCTHMFCIECIQEWTKSVNNCPVDRKKFNSISIMLTKDGPVIEEVYVEDKEIKEDVYEDPPTYCQICGECDREEAMLLCDECDNGYHLDCLDPPLSTVPIDEWHCPECQPVARQRERRVCTEPPAASVDAAARNLMFGQLARTVASSRPGRGRGRARSRGRGRGRSRSASTRSKKKKRKKRNGRKVSKTASSENKNLSSKVRKSLEKARRKHIKEQIRKFREKMEQQGQEPADSSNLYLFGNQYNLDAFYGDPEETYRLQERESSPVRSTIVNTTDVVGSILDGYGTLHPDNVIVHRDGTLKAKEAANKADKTMEESNSQTAPESKSKVYRSSSSSSINGVIQNNFQRRKIRFMDDDDDDDDDENCNGEEKNKIFVNDSSIEKNETGQQQTNASAILKTKEFSKEKAEALKEKMRKRFQEKLEQKAQAEKLKEQLMEIRNSAVVTDFKTAATFHAIAKFKIPKLKQDKKEKQVEKDNERKKGNGLDTNIGHHRKTLFSSPEKKLLSRKSFLPLEKKVPLFREEKVKAKDEKKIIDACGGVSSTEENKSTVTSFIKKSASVAKEQYVSTPKYHHVSSSDSTKKHSSTFKSKVDTIKKPISYAEYKNRKLLEDVFGDPNLELNLKSELDQVENKCTLMEHTHTCDTRIRLNTPLGDCHSNKDNVNDSNNICTSPPSNSAMSKKIPPRKSAVVNVNIKKKLEKSTPRSLDIVSKVAVQTKPVAVISPTLRLGINDSPSQQLQDNLSVKESKSRHSATYEVTVEKTESEHVVDSNFQRSKDITRNEMACKELKTFSQATLLHELNELSSKKEKSAGKMQQKGTTKKDAKVSHLIGKAKKYLKPYYKGKKIVKDDWKFILKKVHGKISAHMDYYSNDERLEKLILGYLSLYKK